MYTLEQGTAAVKAARTQLEQRLVGSQPDQEQLWPSGLPNGFNEKAGVFVTLHTHPGEELRGCVGYPEPVLALHRAVADSALSAALRDTRFPRVKARELGSLVIEVTLLGRPQRVDFDRPSELLAKIVLGRDGIIVDKGLRRGVLLPQVPVEQGWDVTGYLAHGCIKAGLAADAWATPGSGVQVWSFTGQLFKEREPGGQVYEVDLANSQ